MAEKDDDVCVLQRSLSPSAENELGEGIELVRRLIVI